LEVMQLDAVLNRDRIQHTQFQDDSLLYNHVTYLRLNEDAFYLHTHSVCELLFFKSGKASYIVDGRSYSLRKNSLILTRPGSVHYIRIENSEPYERYNILYDAAALLPNMLNKIPAVYEVFHFGGNQVVMDLFEKMDQYAELYPPQEYSRLLHLLIEEVFHHICLATRTLGTAETSDNPLIQQAILYIEENMAQVISIDEICRALFITKSHLHHLFMRHMHISPKKFILQKRLSTAQQAIRAGAKPTNVYQMCGFSEYSTFYRAYKAYFGHKPSDEAAMMSIQEIQS